MRVLGGLVFLLLFLLGFGGAVLGGGGGFGDFGHLCFGLGGFEDLLGVRQEGH